MTSPARPLDARRIERRVPLTGTHAHSAERRREWLVTNGLGGYASGTVTGAMTRRYHGLLIAALNAPLGRMLMLNHLRASVESGGRRVVLDWDIAVPSGAPRHDALVEFRLEGGLPVWRYEIDGRAIERRIVMPYRQNTVHILYHLRSPAREPLRLRLEPFLHVRPHEGPLVGPVVRPRSVSIKDESAELCFDGQLPPLRWSLHCSDAGFDFSSETVITLDYQQEHARGYDYEGWLWSPGHAGFDLAGGQCAGFTASVESWDAIRALTPDQAADAEYERRTRLLESCARPPDPKAAELVLAADQFVVMPGGRSDEVARAHAEGDEARSIIAGYHWFTDWGRDTMISLEGLALLTGRHREAGDILRTFAHYVRDGLIPNMFPEGERLGLYHTADATLWFFHALDRYVAFTGDQEILTHLLPTLVDIVEHHVRGTRFGIDVDPADDLLCQGAEGYQLTWMDAKVGDWVVTPRRGKAVEINALWYNLLRLMADWTAVRNRPDAAAHAARADRARASFNRRFWNADAGFLFDVVDGESGDDPACRPNQIFAVSLPHPVLDRAHWDAVVNVVRTRLLTPVGLRSLAPGHPDYQPQYQGDLRARDAAYHQGTVWAWLMGPFVDAWLKLHPEDRNGARHLLDGFVPHLDQACIGSISEIFDAEPPFRPRGCIAQAWSVAEVLRAWLKTRT